MNYDTIYSHTADKNLIIPNESEILRYLGEKGEKSDILKNLIDEKLDQAMQYAEFKCSFLLKKIRINDNRISIGDVSWHSKKLSDNLSDCHSAVIFSLTSGSGIDRLMQSHSTKPAGEFIISAIASALTESYADLFNKEIKNYFEADNQYTRPRFSPGYGDLSMDVQNDIISLTDAKRRAGIFLTDTLMLTPVKSITGVIGISNIDKRCNISGCQLCDKTDCIIRRI